MTIFEINAVPYGSTGRIMFQIADTVKAMGGISYTSASFTKPRGEHFPDTYYQIGGPVGKTEHMLLARLTGKHGCYSRFATYRLIRKIESVKPDVIHLHNIHGWYLNLKMLFDYLKQTNIPVVWTLHDCWSFTGHCPHFITAECEKWRTGCYECPFYKAYPNCFIDDSKKQYEWKKQWFTGVPDLTIVTPSQWLMELVKQSFLNEYKTTVINNGIDLTTFRPRTSNFREKYALQNKIVILGVSFFWKKQKGLDEFKRLAKDLPEEYAIVMVGVSDAVARDLPQSIIPIACTQNQEELAEIYTAADIFVNPTWEDTFPTVNLEALACGTPVITYETGGSPESVTVDCGRVVPYKDYNALKNAILKLKGSKTVMEGACVRQSENYDRKDKYQQYVKLYQMIIKERK